MVECFIALHLLTFYNIIIKTSGCADNNYIIKRPGAEPAPAAGSGAAARGAGWPVPSRPLKVIRNYFSRYKLRTRKSLALKK